MTSNEVNKANIAKHAVFFLVPSHKMDLKEAQDLGECSGYCYGPFFTEERAEKEAANYFAKGISGRSVFNLIIVKTVSVAQHSVPPAKITKVK